MFFREVAFVFALEVESPGDRVFEGVAGFRQNLHGIVIGDTLEWAFRYKFQALQQFLVDEFIKEIQILSAVVQRILHHVFHLRLGHRHVPLQICERHFRLDHPELRGMPGRIGILRPEGGAEGINIAQCTGERLRLQLSAHGEKRLFPKKILRKIRLPRGQRGHAKHLPRALAIARRDDGRVHIDKSALLKKRMHRKRHPAADAKDRPVKIRARPQMRDAPHEFRGVSFLLQRIRLIRLPQQSQFRRLHLPRLPPSLRGHQFPHHGNAGPGRHFRQMLRSRNPGIRHDLQTPQARTIVDFQKGKGLGITPRSHPSGDENRFNGLGGLQRGENRSAGKAGHAAVT